MNHTNRWAAWLLRRAGRLGSGLAAAAALGAIWCAPAGAQQAAQEAPREIPRAVRPTSPDSNSGFSIRRDKDLFQLEEATGLIASSLSKISDQVATLAINSFYFGKDVDPDFRRKAEVIMLDKVFAANPDVRLIQCAECQKLETKIVNGVLHLRKGIPDADARRELAKKLGADGFIDIGMFRDEEQITVYLKVTDAESGAIILVDELVGRKAAETDWHWLGFSGGEMVFPIKILNKVVSHNALVLTVTQRIKLTPSWSFGVDLGVFTDNNETLDEAHIELPTGLYLSPVIYWDFYKLPASTTQLSFYFGIGKLLSPTLSYGNFARAGFNFLVGDKLFVVMGANNFVETNVDLTDKELAANGGEPAPLSGTGYEIRFGWRF